MFNTVYGESVWLYKRLAKKQQVFLTYQSCISWYIQKTIHSNFLCSAY